MATSGTTTFNPDIAELIEEAFDRAGYQGRSGYEYRTAVRSANLLMVAWSNAGLNLWAVDEQSQALSSGDGQYNLPADTVDIIDQVVRINGQDARLERIGVGSWAAIANKSQTNSRPSQIYVERLLTPRVNVWPVPNNNDCTLVYWRLRRVQDAGTPDKTMDIPYRFLEAFCAGLSAKLYEKKRGQRDPQKQKELNDAYAEQFGMAMSEDRGREPFRLFPRTRR